MTLITELTDERLSRPNMDKWDIYWDSLRASLTREASKDARIRELGDEVRRLEDNEETLADIQVALAAENERLREIYRTGLILRECDKCSKWLSNWQHFIAAIDRAKAEYAQEDERAAIAAKLDREKIARTPADDGAPGYYDKQDKYVKDHYRSRADIAIDYFKE